MLLQFRKNPIADYQQVTNDEILPEFQNNFPSLDFIARKSRLRKSKCKENGPYYDKVIIFIPCSSGAEIHKILLRISGSFEPEIFTFYLSHFIRPLIAQMNTDSFHALFKFRSLVRFEVLRFQVLA